jgi:hypothetical protein
MSFDRTGSSIIETQNILQNGCLEKVRGDVVMVVEKNEHDFIDSLSLSIPINYPDIHQCSYLLFFFNFSLRFHPQPSGRKQCNHRA